MAMISRRLFCALPAIKLITPALAGNADTARPDLSLEGYLPTFTSDFTALQPSSDLPPHGSRWADLGQWTPRYRFNKDLRGCSFPGEYQWYVDPRHDWGPGIGRLSPFSVTDGVLSIVAQQTPESILSKLPGRIDNDKKDTSIPYPWISGVITTQNSFWYRYGYAEALVKLPAGQALWPAFWLLPKEWPYSPEIDIMEHISHEPRKSNYNVIPGTPDKPMDGMGDYADRGLDLTQDWHSFGCLWTPEKFDFFIDRKLIGSVPAHPTMDKCHYYLIVNLAVGGKWPGPPGPQTPSPAMVQVRHVKVWQKPS
ncbi:MAG: glycoside hydrolase family 16 protein [Hyphomicrobium sp.]|nr:glycoside hydrolase family 16 protein [Hyphomicrobium sp.]